MAEAASHVIASSEPGPPWVGRSIPRVEDAALLTGRGRFIDDLGVRPGTLHAAILRSPHAHADIVSIDLSAAKLAPGVVAVLDWRGRQGADASLVVGVKAPVECWPIAVGRVRYVGEPVAIVVATDRYLAEDAVDLIEVRVPAAAGRGRSAGGAAPGCAGSARRLSGQCRQRPDISLRRSGAGLCLGGASDQYRHSLSAQFLHADRNLWRGRRI